MEKLVMLNAEEQGREFALNEKRVRLGRDQSNDICLGDKSVSRHHATVMRIFTEYFLQDEKSTNGTLLNGHPINKHILKHGDEITIGKYQLRYQAGAGPVEEEDPDRTLVMRPMASASARPAAHHSAPAAAAKPLPNGRVRYLSGSEQGETKELDRAFYTIGKPGGDLILINRRRTGYFLLRMGGEHPPTVNGQPVQLGGVQLQNGDKIRIGELQLEFLA